jgi:hypothetical protein
LTVTLENCTGLWGKSSSRDVEADCLEVERTLLAGDEKSVPEVVFSDTKDYRKGDVIEIEWKWKLVGNKQGSGILRQRATYKGEPDRGGGCACGASKNNRTY